MGSCLHLEHLLLDAFCWPYFGDHGFQVHWQSTYQGQGQVSFDTHTDFKQPQNKINRAAVYNIGTWISRPLTNICDKKLLNLGFTLFYQYFYQYLYNYYSRLLYSESEYINHWPQWPPNTKATSVLGRLLYHNHYNL